MDAPPPTPRTRYERAKALTRSGLRRYPRTILRAFGWDRPGRVGPPKPEPAIDRHSIASVWLGHATALLRVGGLNILTDPVLSERIGPGMGRLRVGIPRLAPVPIDPEDLPRIDVILLSHAHFDHLDKPTLRRLVSPRTTVITARSTRRLVPPGFGRVIELDWNEAFEHAGLRFSALRPRHWGARTALDRHRGYNSYVIDSEDHRVLFAGDTAYTDVFRRVKNVDLALLGIGAYGAWEHAHATPEQAWEMFRDTGAQHMLPIHHSTFPLGEEHPDEPMQRLLAAAAKDQDRVITTPPGKLWAHP